MQKTQKSGNKTKTICFTWKIVKKGIFNENPCAKMQKTQKSEKKTLCFSQKSLKQLHFFSENPYAKMQKTQKSEKTVCFSRENVFECVWALCMEEQKKWNPLF